MGCGASSPSGYHPSQQTEESSSSSSDSSALEDFLAKNRRIWRAKVGENPSARDVVNGKYVLCTSTRGELAARLRSSSLLSCHITPALEADAKADAMVDADGDADELAIERSEGFLLRVLGSALSRQLTLINEVPLEVLPSVDSSTDEFLTDKLGYTLHRLARGWFRGHANGHSCVYIGPRGSGKTYTLRRLALAASVRHPHVRVVYISAKNINAVNHPLRNGLCGLLLGSLKLQGTATATAAPTSEGLSSSQAASTVPTVESGAFAEAGPAPPRSTAVASTVSASPTADVDALLTHLHHEKLRLLVILDEMEALYATRERCAYEVVQEIEALSDVDRGLTAVVGCSSSSLLYPLVKGGNGLPPSLAEAHFPLTKAFTLGDMNGQKLTLRPIPVPTPVDVGAAAPFCKGGDTNNDTCRVFAFALGSNVRRLYDGKLDAPLLAPVASFCNAASKTVAHAQDFSAAHPKMLELLERFYDALAFRNADLLNGIVQPPPDGGSGCLLQGLKLRTIQCVEWSTRFLPLDPETVRAIARVTLAEEGRFSQSLDAMLDFLHYDTALIVAQRGAVHSDVTIFPSSILAVLMHMHWMAQNRFGFNDLARSTSEAANRVPSWLMQNAAIYNNWKGVSAAAYSTLATTMASIVRTR